MAEPLLLLPGATVNVASPLVATSSRALPLWRAVRHQRSTVAPLPTRSS